MGAPAKHSLPNALKHKSIYWIPGRNTTGVKRGSYVYDHIDETTKKRSRKVIVSNIPESKRRDPAVVKEALKQRELFQKQFEELGQTIDSRLSFPEAWELFLEQKTSPTARKPIKPSTADDYASVYNLYLEPAFGKLQMRDFNTLRLRNFTKKLDELVRTPDEIKAEKARLAQERRDAQSGMTRRALEAKRSQWSDKKKDKERERYRCKFITVKRRDNVVLALKSFLSWCAVQHPPLTGENLSKKLTLLRSSKQNRVSYNPAGRVQHLRYNDLQRLLEVLDEMAEEKAKTRIRTKKGKDGEPKGSSIEGEIVCYRPMIETALYSGMRAGELVELRWEDVDFRNEEITVSRSFTHGRIGTTKNEKTRVIPMIDRIWDTLAEWSQICPSNSFVFPNSKGNRLCMDNFRARVWNVATDKAGIPGTRIHDLRHLYASWLVSLNVNPAVIQQVMSHSSWETTRGYLSINSAVKHQIQDAFNAPKPQTPQPKTRRIMPSKGRI